MSAVVYRDKSVDPPVDAELLAKRWPARRRQDECNFCKKPIEQSSTMAICPKKPWWWHERSKQWCNNYVHGSCADSNERQMGREPQQQPQEPVKPYSFAPNAQGDPLRTLLRDMRNAIDAYLGETA